VNARALLPLLALSAALGCSPRAESARSAAPASGGSAARAPAPAPSASASARAPAGDAASEGANAVVAEALEIVARVRELPAKAAVPGERLGRDALRAEVQKMLADEAPPELVAGNTELLFALDTVHADFDLRATLALLYGSQLAGFYDPKAKRMVLAADLGEDGERLTLFHELVHALQDQHYHLDEALDWKPEQSDVQAALHSLCEGDATSAMLDVFALASGRPQLEIPPGLLKLDGLLMQAAPDLASVPGIITRSLISPYADGLAFVIHLRKQRGGWKGVDAAWRRRPLSTEHILHPEKYLAFEPVVPIAPIAAPAGYVATFLDVMGEQSLRLLFEEWAPAPRAAEAASDWGGDRLAVFARGSERVVRWHLAFDNEKAAKRALTTLARGALRPELGSAAPKAPLLRDFADAQAAAAVAGAGRVCRERPYRGAFAAVRHGRHVGVTLGPYARTGTDVRSAGACPQALLWAQELARQQ